MTSSLEKPPAATGRRPDALPALNGAVGFDPYRAWLGVREVHRPLTAYQLLGLAPLEEDDQAIRTAAGIQRMALHAHRFEAPPEVWDQVHSELEEAVAILLDPDRKTAYDVTLRLQEKPDTAPQGSPVAITGHGTAATVRCGHCGSASSAMRRFCANCGENLWEPCFKCGTLSMSCEKFCGACGANLAGVIQEQLARIESAVTDARRLSDEARYDEAIERLATVTGLNHVRLAAAVKSAAALLEEITAQRDHRKAATEASWQEAQRAMAEADYEAAVRALGEVPPALRSPGMERLLAEARDRIGSVAGLEAEIRQMLAGRQTADLLPRVGRLLELRPNHPLGQQLAKRLRGRRYQAALKKLEEHRYDAALKLVEHVPRSAWSPEMESLHERLSDILSMIEAVRRAPVVDQAILGIAARLAKMTAGDERLARWHADLAARAAQAAQSGGLRPAPWAKAPPETHVGPAVRWMTDLRRIAVKDEARERLREHPGRFYVACGLALQGLGLGPARTNLAIREDRGLVQWVSQLASTPILFSRPARSAWGLDLSPSGLKAVRLVAEEPDRTATIAACDLVEHRKTLGQAVNDEERKTLIAETLRTFCGRNDVQAERVSVGLPGRVVLVRELTVPRTEGKKLPRVVEYEARRQLPIPLDDLVWGFELLEEQGGEPSAGGEMKIAVVAARRFLLKDHLARFSNAGLTVDVVQSDCVALYNYVAYDRLASGGNGSAGAGKAPPIAVVDVGSDATHVVAGVPGSAWFRTSGFGAQGFTKALIQQFKLTTSQAEALKRDPASAERTDRYCRTLEPLYDELAREIRACLDAYGEARGRRRLECVYGAGGGFQTHGLLRYLWWGR